EPTVDEDTNTSYFSNAVYDNVDQRYMRGTSGYNSKFSLNFASQYEDFLYLGATINLHSLVYDRVTYFNEGGYDAGSPIQAIAFDNVLHTEGNGFSFNLGAIGKLGEMVRIGASYQSPTWYTLTDDTAQRISSNLAVADIEYINFRVVNLYGDYKIKTPGKIMGSLALVFGQEGLISFDYGHQDMSKAELRPASDPNFAGENE